MNDRKYILVGLFVLGGLIILATLIIWFRGVAELVQGGYVVSVHLPTSDGVRGGKPVTQDGLPVGYVMDATSSLPERPGVWIRIRITGSHQIPQSATFVAQQNMVGEIALDFKSAAALEVYPATEYLPMDGTARLEGLAKGVSLLPESIVGDLHDGIVALGRGAEQLRGLDILIVNLKELTDPRTLADLKAGKHENLWTTLAQFEEAARAIQNQLQNADSPFGKLLANGQKAVEDFRSVLGQAGKSVETIGKAAESAGKTLSEFDAAAQTIKTTGDRAVAFLDKLSKDSDQLAALLKNLNDVIADARQGKGTLGQLIATDQLHRELVNLVENLQSMSDNANRLITMWREKGLLSKEGK
jgi:phospholipid/cholesterol/gamma-HCH transport system substrate-binding protein